MQRKRYSCKAAHQAMLRELFHESHDVLALQDGSKVYSTIGQTILGWVFPGLHSDTKRLPTLLGCIL